MILNLLKSTFFLVLITTLSCGNHSENNKQVTEIQGEAAPSQPPLILGANRVDAYLPLLKNKKVGVVGNHTSIIFSAENDKKIHLVDSLMKLEVNVVKVFAPEHGFRGKADAGEVIKDGTDVKTGLPVASLYGDNKKPSAQQLEGIEIMIFDIQDVGTRFYTYLSTLHYVMEACAENDIPLIVLDRPNPNGHYIDGPILEPQHQSFVGMHPVPVVHGLTFGEFAKMINGENWLKNGVKTDLTVIEMKNYTHDLAYQLPVKPSPNLPNAKSINLYPSLCFFEGTNVNAGRGTSHQFQVFGSPFLDQDIYTYSYVPESNAGSKYPKHKGKTCYGKNLTDAQRLSKINLKWLINAYKNTTDQSEFFKPYFTKLAGTTKLQEQIEAGMTAKEIRESWKSGLENYAEMKAAYLLYE